MIDRIEPRTVNGTFTIGGISCYADSFVGKEGPVLRMNFMLKSPPIAKLQNVLVNIDCQPNRQFNN
jgi:hypothetical protein